MDPEAKTAGVFPFVVRETDSKSRINVLEIPRDLTEVESSCLQHGIEMSRFFMAVWSIVFCQFTERDCLYFGFEDLTNDWRTKICAELVVVQATIQPHTELDSLVRGKSLGTKILSPTELRPTCNTALYIVQDDRKMDPGHWLESTKFGNLVGFAL